MALKRLLTPGLLLVMAISLITGCAAPAATSTTATKASPAASKPAASAEASKPADQPGLGGPSGTPPTQAPSKPVVAASKPTGSNIKLSDPVVKGTVSLEEVLQTRRSVRSYADAPLSLGEVSQLLWAAQGVTTGSGQRTAPSAMRSYTIDVYMVVNNVEGLDRGVYLYVPSEHSLARVRDAAGVTAIAGASRGGTAPITIILAGEFDKISSKIGTGKERFVYMEGGHVAQNICLEATALNLGTVTAAGFDEEKIKTVLGITGNTGIIYWMPVGKKSS